MQGGKQHRRSSMLRPGPQYYGALQKLASGLRLSFFRASSGPYGPGEKIFCPAGAGRQFFNSMNILWPPPDSNRNSLAGSRALNALPYFTSPSGISVHLQILSVAARSRNGIIPAHCGAIYFYRRLFLLSYKTQ
jgi:hypothetical protein